MEEPTPGWGCGHSPDRCDVGITQRRIRLWCYKGHWKGNERKHGRSLCWRSQLFFATLEGTNLWRTQNVIISKPHHRETKILIEAKHLQYLFLALNPVSERVEGPRCNPAPAEWELPSCTRRRSSLLIHHIREATEHTRFLHKHSFVGSSHVKGQTWTGRRLLSGLLVFSFITLKADKISTSSSRSLSHQSSKKKKSHTLFCWPWSYWLSEADTLPSIR